jgi:Arc/MetJ family transcription regulator
MRTNIVIDDALMKEALALSKLRTKREVVDHALRGFVQEIKKRNLADLRGKIGFAEGYDHKAARRR